MPVIAHKKLGITAELLDFSQAKYEEYHTKLLKLTANNNSIAVANGAVVRSAIEAGFLKGIEEKEIDSMKPAAVLFLTREIHKHILDVTTVPADDPN